MVVGRDNEDGNGLKFELAMLSGNRFPTLEIASYIASSGHFDGYRGAVGLEILGVDIAVVLFQHAVADA